jgi:hypothetical protein
MVINAQYNKGFPFLFACQFAGIPEDKGLFLMELLEGQTIKFPRREEVDTLNATFVFWRGMNLLPDIAITEEMLPYRRKKLRIAFLKDVANKFYIKHTVLYSAYGKQVKAGLKARCICGEYYIFEQSQSKYYCSNCAAVNNERKKNGRI